MRRLAALAALLHAGCYTVSVETGGVATWDLPPEPHRARAEPLVYGSAGFGVGLLSAGIGLQANPSGHGTEYALLPHVCAYFPAVQDIVFGGGCAGFSAPSFGAHDGEPARGAFGPTLRPSLLFHLGQVNGAEFMYFPWLRVGAPMGYDVRHRGRGDAVWIGAAVGVEVWIGRDLPI